MIRRVLYGGIFAGDASLCGCESEPHTCTTETNPEETMTTTTQQIAADAFNAFFKYPIGAHLAPAEMVAAYAADAEINGPVASRMERITVPYGLVVVERLLQQCHGGVQGFYLVRRRVIKDGGGHADSLERYAALELVPWADLVAACRAMAPEKKPPRNAWDGAVAAGTPGLAAMDAIARSKARDAEEDGGVPESAPMPNSNE